MSGPDGRRHRVWDDFLSEQDKLSLEGRPARGAWGLGERPALVLIDVYRAVFGDRPEPLLESMKEWPASCGMAAWNALPHICRLLESCRRAGLPIVHLTALGDEAGVPSWTSRGDGVGRWGALPDAESIERYRRRFDIVDEVRPLPGEAVLTKAAPSAFWGTPLVGHLTALRVDSLIICGESTSGCVRATVVDARSHRYRVTVAEEAVFDRHEASHAVNLFDMSQKYADVLPVDEIVAALPGLIPAELP